jgi:hypothetical protein
VRAINGCLASTQPTQLDGLMASCFAQAGDFATLSEAENILLPLQQFRNRVVYIYNVKDSI